MINLDKDVKNIVKYRFFIKGDLEFISPFSIGSGKDFYTDRDVLLDADLKPYIPGSSLAGVIRDFISKSDKGFADKFFGMKDETGGVTKGIKSQIYFYHAYLKSGGKVGIRDGVAIDYEWGTAKDNYKYDYQFVDAGSIFDFRIEIEYRDEDVSEMEKYLNKIIAALQSAILRFGYKKNRGFGKAILKNVSFVKFDMSNKDDVTNWINFSWDALKEQFVIEKGDLSNKDDNIFINVQFSIPFHLLIRDFVLGEKADFVHIMSNGKSVIPGTSWAGFFRHTLYKMLSEVNVPNLDKILDSLFGYVRVDKNEKESKNKDKTVPSKIRFDESVIESGKRFDYTRNRIDRFSGGVVNGALFTEKSQYEGNTVLSMYLPEKFKDLILLVLREIDEGLAAIGGSVSVGKGILELEEVNVNGEIINLSDGDLKEFTIPEV